MTELESAQKEGPKKIAESLFNALCDLVCVPRMARQINQSGSVSGVSAPDGWRRIAINAQKSLGNPSAMNRLPRLGHTQRLEVFFAVDPAILAADSHF